MKFLSISVRSSKAHFQQFFLKCLPIGDKITYRISRANFERLAQLSQSIAIFNAITASEMHSDTEI